MPFLPPGNYLVTVEAAGFRRVERQNVRLGITGQLTLNFALEIGATTESVTVTEAAPRLNTANAELGQMIDNRYVGMISVSLSRNVINLRNMAPGGPRADGSA